MTLVLEQVPIGLVLLEAGQLAVEQRIRRVADGAVVGALLLVVALERGVGVVQPDIEAAWTPVALELHAAILALNVVGVLDDGHVVLEAEEIGFARSVAV